MKAKELASFQKPSDRDYRSVRRFFSNTNPLVDKEQAFILHKEDVLTLHSGREWGGFDRSVEWLLLKLDCRLIQVSTLCVTSPIPPD